MGHNSVTMTKALRVNVHPRVIELGKEIERSNKSFRDLKFENQVMLAESELHLEGLATKEELQQYEIEKQLREAETPLETLRARVQRVMAERNPPLINNG